MPNVDLERTRWPWAFCYSDLAPKSLKRLTCSVEINEEQLHLHIKVCLYMIIRKEIPVFKAKHIIYLKTYRLEEGGGFVAKYPETRSFRISVSCPFAFAVISVTAAVKLYA